MGIVDNCMRAEKLTLDIGEGVKNRVNFAPELFEIGRLETPEAKSFALRGRFDLAVDSLHSVG